jgi:hypothetical protein
MNNFHVRPHFPGLVWHTYYLVLVPVSLLAVNSTVPDQEAACTQQLVMWLGRVERMGI